MVIGGVFMDNKLVITDRIFFFEICFAYDFCVNDYFEVF